MHDGEGRTRNGQARSHHAFTLAPLSAMLGRPMSDEQEEGEIVRNSRVDTLYTNAFQTAFQGEGRFFNVTTLEDGARLVDCELTPRVRISILFFKEGNQVTSIRIQKFRFITGRGFVRATREHVEMRHATFEKVLGLIKFLTDLDLASISERRITLTKDTLPAIDAKTRQQLHTLLAHDDGPAIIEQVLKSEAVSSKDIVNVGYRKAQLREFSRLLNQSGYIEEYKKAHEIPQKGAEAAWQGFFERNPWILGYGLNYIWCANLPDSALEQIVAGADFNVAGKRVDALLQTSAHISQFVLAEVKTPSTRLLAASSPRSGVWPPHADLLSGVAQSQKTVMQFKQRYFAKAQLKGASGAPLGIDVFNFAPRSFLIIGTLAEFHSDHGVNEDQYSSFELFRHSLREPEIITFDELYQRAEAIVSHSERA